MENEFKHPIKISIIVPIYNVERYIEEGIKKLCGQTWKELEIILVDDGSTDNSGAICDAYAQKDMRIKVYHIENSGQSHARNVGLSHASGELIGFVDGDDAPDIHMYERLYSLMEQYDADIVECNFVGRNSPPSDKLEEGAEIVLTGREALKKQINLKVPSRFPSTAVWSKLFKKEMLRGIRFPDGCIHEEYAFLCEALLRCKTYVYVNEILYNRTLRGDSTTKEKFSIRTLDKLKVHRMRNTFLESQKEEELLQLSRVQEYNLMIHFYNQTTDHGMPEAQELERELRENKRSILTSALPWKKKAVFGLFCINQSLYHKVRNGTREKEGSKKKIIISMLLAFLFSFFALTGWQLETMGETRLHLPGGFFLLLFAFLLFLGAIHYGFAWLKKIADKSGEKVKLPPFFVIQASMIVCWIPVLMAAYPGFFCYDATYQLNEMIQGSFDTHHPLLHTFLLGKTLTVWKDIGGSFEAGVLFYCIMQMIVTTACFSATLRWMAKHGAGKMLLFFSFLYYALYPVNVMFGLCTTKDSIFTALMLICLMYIFELAQKGKLFFADRKKTALFAVTAVLALLFRNNGIYSLLLFLPVLLFYVKEARKEILLFFTGIILVVMFINKGLQTGMNAEETDGLREMLSIPAQQLARTYQENGKEFFGDDLDALYSFISEEDLNRYNEKLADPVKANLHVGFNRSLLIFSKLWVKAGIKAPKVYVEAALLQTYQAWYPLTIPDGYCGVNAKPKYRGSESCYFAMEAEEPVRMESKIPALYDFYRFISRDMSFRTVPVIPVFFSIGTMFWVMFFILGYHMVHQNRGACCMLAFLLCLCLTCLFGPIVLVRYYLLLFYALPLTIGSILCKD